MIEAIKSWGLKLLSKLLPVALRWIYTKDKILEMIEITISSENDGIVINCSELPDARAWLEITNLSPFTLKLIGIEAILYLVGRAAEFKSLQYLEIKPHAKKEVCIETSLNELQAKHVKKNASDKPRLFVSLFLDSSIRPLNKQRNIHTSNIRLLNCSSE